MLIENNQSLLDAEIILYVKEVSEIMQLVFTW